jgi:hypothetical protein
MCEKFSNFFFPCIYCNIVPIKVYSINIHSLCLKASIWFVLKTTLKSKFILGVN